MTIERVVHPMGGEQEKDLFKPSELEMAAVNQMDTQIGPLLQQLGFETVNDLGKSLVLMKTPATILDKEWGIFLQDKSADPRLFTLCVQEGPVYMHLFRQMPHPWKKGKYCIFFIA